MSKAIGCVSQTGQGELEQGESIGDSSADMASLNPDSLYESIAGEYAAALARLASAYEVHPQRRQDLLQDIHFKLWRSLSTFNHQCSLRTWVYRVAHNTAATYVLRERRQKRHALCDLETLETMPENTDDERKADGVKVMEQLHTLIRKLKPLDRQIVLLQLEGLKPGEIAAITGLSPGNVAIKLHRFTELLRTKFASK